MIDGLLVGPCTWAHYLHAHNPTPMRPSFILFACITFGAMLCDPGSVQAQSKSPDAIEVVFTPSTSEAELLMVKDRMKAQNVELTYTDLQFKSGKLHSLAFKLVTDKGEGTASGVITEGERFGFYYDPAPQQSDRVSFIVGGLPAW